MSTFNEKLVIAAFDDSGCSIPVDYAFNWSKPLVGIQVTDPTAFGTTILPGASKTVFNGVVATTIDGTTVFNLGTNPVIPNTYRFTYVSGTTPGFRTDRGLTLSGSTAALTVNNDGTATFSIDTGSLAALQVGDTLFVPGISTGDGLGPLSPSNEGAWSVLSVSTLSVLLARPGPVFQGLTQTGVVLTSNTQVLGFSAAGTQIGNTLVINGGFSAYSVGNYIITQVTPNWIEVTSLYVLPAQTNVTPTAANMLVYNSLKRFLRIESNCTVTVQLNGDPNSYHKINPILIQDGSLYGMFETMSAVYSLTLVNPTLNSAAVRIFSWQ